jgi:hypothetical protein
MTKDGISLCIGNTLILSVKKYRTTTTSPEWVGLPTPWGEGLANFEKRKLGAPDL